MRRQRRRQLGMHAWDAAAMESLFNDDEEDAGAEEMEATAATAGLPAGKLICFGGSPHQRPPPARGVDEGYASWEEPSPLAARAAAAAAAASASSDSKLDLGLDSNSKLDLNSKLDSSSDLNSNSNETTTSSCAPVAIPRRSRHLRPSLPRATTAAARLPPELLLMVLRCVRRNSSTESQRTLAAACSVNRHWHRFAIAALWEHPVLLSETAITRIAATLPLQSRISSLSQSSSTSRSFGSLIKKLDLGRVRLHEPSHSALIAAFSNNCPSIRAIRIWCESISILTLQSIATCSPHLETLVVAGHLHPWFDVCNSSIAGLTRAISRLRVIQIDVGFDGDTGRNRLANIITENVGPSLRRLRLAGADDDARVAAICARCPHLEVLLYGWANISEAAVASVAASSHNLRVLDLRGCQKAVTPAVIASLVAACPNIEAIDLSFTNSSDAILPYITDHAPAIHTAILAGIACSEATLLRFIERVGPRLRVFSIAWFGGAMTDHTILAIARHCPVIEKLDVRGCRLVSESALRTLVESCRYLSVLKIEGPGVRDGGITVSSVVTPTSSSTVASSSSLSRSPIHGRRRRRSSSNNPVSNTRFHQSSTETSRCGFLSEIRKRFPSDELVRLEESLV